MMARPKLPGVPSALLVAVVLVMSQPQPGIASKPEPTTTPSRLPPLLDCGPAAPVAPAESDGAFRANLLSLLRFIPSAVAATPAGGFAAARRSGGRTGRDRAFARALCFGGSGANLSSSSSGACRACLSVAARDVTGGCGASRRAGVWRAGCFLGYADTDAASAHEDAFRGWFYADPNTTATAALKDGVCVGERTDPDCGRCFEDAARAAAALRSLVRLRGEQVVVVGYRCCLRVQISVLPTGPEITTFTPGSLFFMWMTCWMFAELAIVIGLLYEIIVTLRDDIPHLNQ